MTPPPQHMNALKKANKLRIRRGHIKGQLYTLPRGEAFAMLADLLETVPECCETATAMDLLTSCKRVGRFYALAWIRKAGVQEGRQLRELTVRQRGALATLLRDNDPARVAA